KAAVTEIRREFNVHPYPLQIDTAGKKLFFDVAQKMGYHPPRPGGAPRNCLYFGFCSRPLPRQDDSRAGNLVTYLPGAEKYGVEILPDLYVEKVLIEARNGRGKAVGVACRAGGSTFEIRADKIVVSCGYYNTPSLLMRSGYGPAEWKGNAITVVN